MDKARRAAPDLEGAAAQKALAVVCGENGANAPSWGRSPLRRLLRKPLPGQWGAAPLKVGQFRLRQIGWFV